MKKGRGRQPGYVASDETKRLIAQNNAWRTPVTTPDGEFDSLTAAARYYRVTPAVIAYRCEIAKEKRTPDGIPDRLWEKWQGWSRAAINPAIKGFRGMCRPVRTPWGDFESAADAARAVGRSPVYVSYRVRTGKAGYQYL